MAHDAVPHAQCGLRKPSEWPGRFSDLRQSEGTLRAAGHGEPGIAARFSGRSSFAVISLLPVPIIQRVGADDFAFGGTDEPFLAVGIMARFADGIIGDDV